MELRRPSRGTITMIRNKWFILGFRLVVGGLFIWAGVLKVIDPLGFAQSIENYRLFPRELAFIIAVILPWVEVLSGACLIVDLFRRSSALIISVLLIGFIGLVAVAMWRGIDTNCGCFGSLSRKADLQLVLMDSVLLFLTLNVLFARSHARFAPSSEH
jgi:putative oxidoreductase